VQVEPIDPQISKYLQNWSGEFQLPVKFLNHLIQQLERWLHLEKGIKYIKDMFQGPYPIPEMQFGTSASYKGVLWKLMMGSYHDNFINHFVYQHYGPLGTKSIF